MRSFRLFHRARYFNIVYSSRSYRQNGPNARTNALFLAVSHEEDLDAHHDISPNGYDMGR